MDTYVITAGTPSHDSLRHQFFEPSLQRCEPVNWIHYQRPSGSNPRGDFGCGDWLEVMRWKLECAIRASRMLPEDVCFVLSDLDIVWMPGAFQELNLHAKTGIYAMCENDQAELNAGLLMSRNTREFHWLLHHCLAYMHMNPGKHDQDALRATARDRVSTLPVCFANTKTQRLTPVPKVLCFHAICTMADEHQSSIEKKLGVLRGWLDGTITSANVSLPA